MPGTMPMQHEANETSSIHDTTSALFFSMGNLGCGMGECGKGGKKWVRVGKNGISF